VEAFDHYGIDTGRYLGTLPVTSKLPWDHIDVGLEPGFLAKEYKKALKNRLSPPCGKAVGQFVHHTSADEHDADAKKLVCYNCGVACDLGAMRTERRDFLLKLGALTKKVRPVTPSSVGDGAREQKPVGKRMPTAQFDQGTPLRVRIAYTKLGRAAYRSHLDLVRLLPRIFRRLDLPLYYSQGFHPKPEMSFGPALPLGVASHAEYVDVKLVQAPGIDEASVRERLCGASLEGITFRDARVLGANDAGVAKVIDTAEYVVGLLPSELAELGLGTNAALAAHFAARLALPLTVVRDMKGIKRTIDVSHYLRAVSAGEGADALHAAGLRGELTPFRFVVNVSGQGGVRPSEVLATLFPGATLSLRIVRTFMGSDSLEPLALEALRARTPLAKPEQTAEEPPAVLAEEGDEAQA
jgi:radical SAM-linked protein